jgi:hypothetical protein
MSKSYNISFNSGSTLSGSFINNSHKPDCVLNTSSIDDDIDTFNTYEYDNNNNTQKITRRIRQTVVKFMWFLALTAMFVSKLVKYYCIYITVHALHENGEYITGVLFIVDTCIDIFFKISSWKLCDRYMRNSIDSKKKQR